MQRVPDNGLDHQQIRARKPLPVAVTRTAQRQSRERAGRIAELIAAIHLTLKGYRILASRQRTRLGEIDIIAVRGKRLAFVEVKLRQSEELARDAISDQQARRIADAAEHWVWQRKRYRTYEIGLDSVLVVPCRVPHHIPNALQPD